MNKGLPIAAFRFSGGSTEIKLEQMFQPAVEQEVRQAWKLLLRPYPVICPNLKQHSETDKELTGLRIAWIDVPLLECGWRLFTVYFLLTDSRKYWNALSLAYKPGEEATQAVKRLMVSTPRQFDTIVGRLRENPEAGFLDIPEAASTTVPELVAEWDGNDPLACHFPMQDHLFTGKIKGLWEDFVNVQPRKAKPAPARPVPPPRGSDKASKILVMVLSKAPKEKTKTKLYRLWHSVADLYAPVTQKDKRSIGVYGCPKMGKSTLLNSIVGVDILPRGIVPVTGAVIDLQRKDDAPGYTVCCYVGESLDDEVSFSTEDKVDKTRDYLSKVAGQNKPVDRVEVTGPFPDALPFFSDQCWLRDAPGAVTAGALTDESQSDSGKTLRSIDEVCLPLFCVSTETIGQKEDVEFYQEYFANRICIHVLTKEDDGDEEGRRELRDGFMNAFGITPDDTNPRPIVFTGKDDKESPFVSKKSLEDLETTLSELLSEDKAQQMLRNCCNVILNLYRDRGGIGWEVPHTIIHRIEAYLNRIQ